MSSKLFPQFVRNQLPVPVNRDVCRTPMQWSDQPNAGFCPKAGNPWLPVAGELEIRNVTSQSGDKNSLLSTYKQLSAIRNHHEALRQGSIELLPPRLTGKHILAYVRTYEGQKIGVALNFSGKTRDFHWPEGISEELWTLNKEDGLQDKNVTLSPYGGILLAITPAGK